MDPVATSISAGSLIIAALALRKSYATDRRDREAVLSIDCIWQGQTVTFPFGEASRVDLPRAPDKRYVIAPEPVIAEKLVLREANGSDDLDVDRANYTTHRALIEIRNAGRAAAEAPTLNGSITAKMFDAIYKNELTERTFPASLSFASIAAGNAVTIEVRSMVGVPVVLTFDSVTCAAGRQPARIIAAGGATLGGRS